MKDTTDSGFIVGGYNIYISVLEKEEQDKLAPLKSCLKLAITPAEKALIKGRIKKTKKEYRTKRADSDYSLF